MCRQHPNKPRHIKPLRDLSPEYFREDVELTTTIRCRTAKSCPVVDLAAGLGLTCNGAFPLAVETHTVFVLGVDMSTAVAPLTPVTTPQGPWLEPGFSVALEKQPYLT